MEQTFGHMPFARLARQDSTLSQKEDTSLHGKDTKRKDVQSPASPLSSNSREKNVVQMDDVDLFLQAMGGLVQVEAKAVLPHKKNDARKKYNRVAQSKAQKVPISEGLVPLSESFAQLFSPSPQEKHKQVRHEERVSSGTNPKRDSKQQQIPQQEENDMTMESLLSAQKAVANGNDAEGMDAFFTAMKEVSPLVGKGRDIVPEVQPLTPAGQAHDAFALMMEKKLEFSLALKGEYMEGHVVGLDELTMNNLRAGVYSPEAHLDLHGLNTMQAYTAMSGFFKGAWYKGLRTLLLIPGRGKNSPNGVSVLREKVQLWLTQDPFKRVVLAFCTAQPVDGGPGTVYVLLRKYKKKGKVCWERLPTDPDLY